MWSWHQAFATTNKHWKFKETYGGDGNNILTVRIKEYGFERIVNYNGVFPNGKMFIKDIAESIRRKIPDFIKQWSFEADFSTKTTANTAKK